MAISAEAKDIFWRSFFFFTTTLSASETISGGATASCTLGNTLALGVDVGRTEFALSWQFNVELMLLKTKRTEAGEFMMSTGSFTSEMQSGLTRLETVSVTDVATGVQRSVTVQDDTETVEVDNDIVDIEDVIAESLNEDVVEDVSTATMLAQMATELRATAAEMSDLATTVTQLATSAQVKAVNQNVTAQSVTELFASTDENNATIMIS